MALTLESILQAVRNLERVTGPAPDPYLRGPYWRSALAPYNGVRLISDPYCLKETDERLFPASRHRSRRILKKLLKRFGGEYRRVPAMFKIGADTIVCHPVLYEQIKSHAAIG